ncbi:MAG: transposase [Sphingobacteriales bacterium]|nr:transposase [Sphingobacteriales bacterium]
MPAFLLNVVSTKATNLKTGKVAYRHLFSNDLQLDAQTMMAYYTLRFQIEFDFRDAKQHFGLHKFKNYHQTQLNNMFNLAFLALVAAKVWQQQWAIKLKQPKISLLDLKTIIKAQKKPRKHFKIAQKQPNVLSKKLRY